MSTSKPTFVFADNLSSIATDQDFLLKVPSGVESTADLFSWYQKEARFPDYFGRNWDAFLDCLRDFSWIEKKRIIIAHADVPLSGNEKELRTYLEILATVVDDWKEVKEGPLAEHPREMPFFEHELVVIFPSAAEARIMNLLGSREQTTRDNT
jgi:RNAse (barnase) inhibitor barstar